MRDGLNSELLTHCDNVYFQPPSNVRLNYPCVIYHKSGYESTHANDSVYGLKTEYQLTVIQRDPEGVLDEQILKSFPLCRVTTTFVSENLYHTFLTLYYK